MQINLYVVNEVLCDREDREGMVVIAAPSIERAKDLFVSWFADLGEGQIDNQEVEMWDEAIRNKCFIEIKTELKTEGIVSYVFGRM